MYFLIQKPSKKGFAISGADEKWSDFLEDDPGRLALVKSYMHLKVRLPENGEHPISGL